MVFVLSTPFEILRRREKIDGFIPQLCTLETNLNFSPKSQNLLKLSF